MNSFSTMEKERAREKGHEFCQGDHRVNVNLPARQIVQSICTAVNRFVMFSAVDHFDFFFLFMKKICWKIYSLAYGNFKMCSSYIVNNDHIFKGKESRLKRTLRRVSRKKKKKSDGSSAHSTLGFRKRLFLNVHLFLMRTELSAVILFARRVVLVFRFLNGSREAHSV